MLLQLNYIAINNSISSITFLDPSGGGGDFFKLQIQEYWLKIFIVYADFSKLLVVAIYKKPDPSPHFEFCEEEWYLLQPWGALRCCTDNLKVSGCSCSWKSLVVPAGFIQPREYPIIAASISNGCSELDDQKHISSRAEGGPGSRLQASETLRSAPHVRERKQKCVRNKLPAPAILCTTIRKLGRQVQSSSSWLLMKNELCNLKTPHPSNVQLFSIILD